MTSHENPQKRAERLCLDVMRQLLREAFAREGRILSAEAEERVVTKGGRSLPAAVRQAFPDGARQLSDEEIQTRFREIMAPRFFREFAASGPS